MDFRKRVKLKNLFFLMLFGALFAFGCKQTGGANDDKGKNQQQGGGNGAEKSSNTKLTSLSIGTVPLNLEDLEEQLVYVDEDMSEADLVASIKYTSKDGKAKIDVKPATEDVFETKPHAQKNFTITAVAENGKKGKTYNVKMVRFIMDKTIPIAKPESPYSSEITFSSLEDFLVLGKNRTVDYDAYEIGKYEVVYKLWKEVYDFAISHGYKFTWNPPSSVENEELFKPIQDVSWGDAVVWCNAYSEYRGGVHKNIHLYM